MSSCAAADCGGRGQSHNTKLLRRFVVDDEGAAAFSFTRTLALANADGKPITLMKNGSSYGNIDSKFQLFEDDENKVVLFLFGIIGIDACSRSLVFSPLSTRCTFKGDQTPKRSPASREEWKPKLKRVPAPGPKKSEIVCDLLPAP